MAFPRQGSDVVIYTGFGYKGRNVVNIRSSDIVVILRGSIGTLNEFTIAYDEGKIIGILEGTGGVADQVREIVHALAKKTPAALFFERDAVSYSGCALLSLQGDKDSTSGRPRFEVDTIVSQRRAGIAIRLAVQLPRHSCNAPR